MRGGRISESRCAACGQLSPRPAGDERRPHGGLEVRMIDALAQDLRYAVRTLGKNPGFTAVVVLTLALGIGANTAIFSVVNGVLLTPLPYKDPSQLMVVWERKGTSSHNVVNPGNYMDWHDRATSFSGLALMGWSSITFAGDQAEHVQGRAVTPAFFGLVGATPLLGSTFHADESRPNSPRVILLSEGLWRRRFGADRGIVGRAVRSEEHTSELQSRREVVCRLLLEN